MQNFIEGVNITEKLITSKKKATKEEAFRTNKRIAL